MTETKAETQTGAGRVVQGVLPGGVLALTAVSFLPVLTLFFAQDDFMLMQRAVNEPGWGFTFTKHHYRPLTKYVYFAAMYKTFGLQPFVYHLMSLLVHVANTWLVYRIVLRLGIRWPAAVVTAALFGMNAAFINAVAWVSCIQQIGGALFFLLCIWTGLRAVQDGSRTMGVVSAGAYVGAVLSLEQTFAAGLILAAMALLGIAGRRHSVRETLSGLWPHLLIFGVYVLARAAKGVPDAGFAGFAYGKNILANLMAYLGALSNPWPVVSGLIAEDPMAPRLSHAVLAGLILYHLLRRRFGPVVFAIGFVMAALFPALFLSGHQFYYHTYVPALGILYLAGLALNDLIELGRMRSHRIRLVASAALVTVLFLGSFTSVRGHFRRASDPRIWDDASFVIRRAHIARRIHDGLLERTGANEDVRRVHMVYFNATKGRVGGHHRDLFWALGNGATVAMSLGNPTLDVVLESSHEFTLQGESATTRIFLYDREGHVYTLREFQSQSW